MPRTKVNRHVGNNKRVRENTAEMEEILRNFEIEAENSIQMLQSQHNQNLRLIDEKFEQLMASVPPRILSMKIKDVMKLENFNDIIIDEKMGNLNVTVKESAQKNDEEEMSRMTSGSESGAKPNVSVLGSLKSLKSRRRSKSVSCLTSAITPGPRHMMSAAKGRTPLAQHPVPHTSRSKYRTPITSSMRKAVSADRITTITPKVNPSFPFSMMRHARAGEAVFSVTGSPIVASNVVEQTANVNIPIADGILSIRPQAMDPMSFDPSLVNQIDQSTYSSLKTLKKNLDIVIEGFNRNIRK